MVKNQVNLELNVNLVTFFLVFVNKSYEIKIFINYNISILILIILPKNIKINKNNYYSKLILIYCITRIKKRKVYTLKQILDIYFFKFIISILSR